MPVNAQLAGGFLTAPAHDTDHASITSLARAPNGDVVAYGNFDRMIDFGGTTVSTGSPNDGSVFTAFIARWSKTGSLLFAKQIGDPMNGAASTLAIAPDGSAFVGGLDGISKVDPGGTITTIQPYGGYSIGALALDASGDIVFSKDNGFHQYLDVRDQNNAEVVLKDLGPVFYADISKVNAGVLISAVAVDTAGAIGVSGVYCGSPDLGGGPLPTKDCASAGVTYGFAAKFDKDGSFVYAVPVETQVDPNHALAFDPAGNLYWADSFFGDTAGGSVTLSSGGCTGSMFLLKLSPTGSVVYANAFPGQCLGTHGQGANALSLEPSGEIVLGGDFMNEFSAGAACDLPLPQAGYGSYLARFDQNGACVKATTAAEGIAASSPSLVSLASDGTTVAMGINGASLSTILGVTLDASANPFVVATTSF